MPIVLLYTATADGIEFVVAEPLPNQKINMASKAIDTLKMAKKVQKILQKQDIQMVPVKPNELADIKANPASFNLQLQANAAGQATGPLKIICVIRSLNSERPHQSYLLLHAMSLQNGKIPQDMPDICQQEHKSPNGALLVVSTREPLPENEKEKE